MYCKRIEYEMENEHDKIESDWQPNQTKLHWTEPSQTEGTKTSKFSLSLSWKKKQEKMMQSLK